MSLMGRLHKHDEVNMVGVLQLAPIEGRKNLEFC